MCDFIRKKKSHRADEPSAAFDQIFRHKYKSDRRASAIFARLMEFGGFPDPYFNADRKFANLWQSGRLEKIIREDLRDLSRLPELSQVELMAALLPDKVGSPLSIQSLREDIEVSHDTISRWLKYLKLVFYSRTRINPL